jgi:hypothetical protein
MEPEVLLGFSQEPSTGHYTETDQSSACRPTLFLQEPFQYRQPTYV